MKISTKKRLCATSDGKKVCGFIDLSAKADNKKLKIEGYIVGDYNTIANFDSEKIKEALELLFDEKVKECDKELIRCMEGF